MSTQVSSVSANTLRRVLVRAIAGGFAFAVIFTAFGSFGPFNGGAEGRSNSELVVGWAVGIAAAVVAGAVVWMAGKSGTRPGNVGGAANRALIFGIVAAVSLPVFWLGIYPLFAAGSFVLGGSAVREATGGTKVKAIAGMVLATIGVVVGASANLFG